ncbi:DUF3857 domain-containing protein [Spirosoma sp. KNUC1025]|uniref:DUF3857 domain-containing protein n=1 Tax=Spirosoma sp. KNUC1025 TaxID=2894082 RepID=UPI00386484C0|nr:DUF3857 and transglutaminase domain-containing protein [Spirosoma sp. KNUC1025]
MFSSLPHQRLLALVIACLFLGATIGFCQKSPNPAPAVKFGSISPDQFTYALEDTTADAVVLYDYGEVTFFVNGDEIWMSTRYHIRKHIRKKSADGLATLQLPVRRGKSGQHEMVMSFDGYTYNLINGNVSIDRLAKSGHFTERASDQVWIEKYTLPNVREGSIIEYEYTVQTPFSVSHTPKSWYFQQKVPVKWSEYRITIPDYFYYKMLQSGYMAMIVNENKTTSVDLFPGQNGASASAYRFAMKDLPAFREEVYMTTDEDYLAKIEFELARYQGPDMRMHDFSVSWETLDKTILADPDFGGQIKRGGFLRETAKTLLAQSPDSLGRIKAAYDFVRRTVKWDERTAWWSNNTKKAFDDRKGTAGDINLLLIALLREMDIEANPVILSTRENGQINELYALIRKFNYVVAQVTVGGKDMLLDATDPYLVPGMLPTHCLNGTGRLVHPSKARFISLAPTEKDTEAQTGTFTLTEDGELAGTIRHMHQGYSAWSARKEFITSGQKKYVETIQKKRPAWQIEKTDFSGTELNDPSFTVGYTITIPEATGRAGDRLYLHPMLTEARTVNPFKEEQRLYPVDFGVLIEETFMASYTLPKGFQVEEMPKPAIVTLPEGTGRFTYQVAVLNENTLQVVSRLMLRRTRYFAEEYPAVREFFSRIVAKHAEQVVLKRGTIAEKK